jgi:hypothetical protein
MPKIVTSSYKALKDQMSWAWSFTPIIPALERQRQDYLEFEASLDYTVRVCMIFSIKKKSLKSKNLVLERCSN